jgi:hypothetical protein
MNAQAQLTRTTFRADGFVVLPGLLAGSRELEDLQARILETVELRARNVDFERRVVGKTRSANDRLLMDLFARDPKNVSFVYDTLRYAPELARLLGCETLVAAVRRVFDSQRAQVVFNNLNLRIDMPGDDWIENLPWHQDWPYNNPLYVQGNSIASWVALFDVPADVGPLVVKRGSQRVGEVTPEKVPQRGTKNRQDVFVYKVPEAVSNDARFEPVQLECSAGDVILFDLTLVHRSGINRSSDRIRWSAQARYHDAAHARFLGKYLLGD